MVRVSEELLLEERQEGIAEGEDKTLEAIKRLKQGADVATVAKETGLLLGEVSEIATMLKKMAYQRRLQEENDKINARPTFKILEMAKRIYGKEGAEKERQKIADFITDLIQQGLTSDEVLKLLGDKLKKE